MISMSLSASALRMANISSCLRMVLAPSISSSSAKASISVGDFALRSCSLTVCSLKSCMVMGGAFSGTGGGSGAAGASGSTAGEAASAAGSRTEVLARSVVLLRPVVGGLEEMGLT